MKVITSAKNCNKTIELDAEELRVIMAYRAMDDVHRRMYVPFGESLAKDMPRERPRPELRLV